MEENPFKSPRAEGNPPPKQSTNRVALVIVLVLASGYAALALLYLISELRFKANERRDRQKSSAPIEPANE